MKFKMLILGILILAVIGAVVFMGLNINTADRHYHREVDRVITIVDDNEDVKAQYLRNYQTSYSYMIYDRETVMNLLEEMNKMSLKKETHEEADDFSDIINIVVNGETYRFQFNKQNAVFNGRIYETQGYEGLYEILNALTSR